MIGTDIRRTEALWGSVEHWLDLWHRVADGRSRSLTPWDIGNLTGRTISPEMSAAVRRSG